MPLKSFVVLLMALCVGVVAAGCGDDAVCSNCGADGDAEVSGEQEAETYPDGDLDRETAEDTEADDDDGLPQTEAEYDEDESDGDVDDDTDAPNEQESWDYESRDSLWTEIAAPGCQGEQEEEAESSGTEDVVLAFDEPVQVNHTDFSFESQSDARAVDCGNGVALAVWRDSRYPLMYALSNDNGRTWTKNRELAGLPRDVDHGSVRFHDLEVCETAAVLFVTVQATGYFIRMPLPVTDFADPGWVTEVQATGIFNPPGEQFNFNFGEMAVTDDGHIMIYVDKSDYERVEYHAVAADWGAASFGIMQHERSEFGALPDNRFLQVAKPEVGSGVLYRLIDPNNSPYVGDWIQQNLDITEIDGVYRSGEHVVIVSRTYDNSRWARSNFNPRTDVFGPVTSYPCADTGCGQCVWGEWALSRDNRLGKIAGSIQWQQHPGDPFSCTDIVWPFDEYIGGSASLLLPETGEKVAVWNWTVRYETQNPGGHNAGTPTHLSAIDVYAAAKEVDAPMVYQGRINDEPDVMKTFYNSRLAPLPQGNVAVAWNSVNNSLWANSLHGAMAGETARWLYNVPALYSSYDGTGNQVEEVYIQGMKDLVTWQGRPCMMTLPALNTTIRYDPSETTWECQGPALSCYDSWSSFMDGERPGPLEVLWCDARGSTNGLTTKEVTLVSPDAWGKGFALVSGDGPAERSGMIVYDDAMAQWSHMQFFPGDAEVRSVGRLDADTMVGFYGSSTIFSWDEGRSWTFPVPLGRFGDYSLDTVQSIQRPGYPFAFVVNLRIGTTRGSISALIWDCEQQAWEALDFPELDECPVDMKAVALEHGNIAVFYGDRHHKVLYGLVLNPETEYRSEPVEVRRLDAGGMLIYGDALYHDGILSLLYLDSSLQDSEGTALYVTQARIEY